MYNLLDLTKYKPTTLYYIYYQVMYVSKVFIYVWKGGQYLMPLSTIFHSPHD